MKLIIISLMLFIVVISSCKLELFEPKNAFYNCTNNGTKPDDYNCVYDGNIPNAVPSDETQQKNYFYCATGTGYGCNEMTLNVKEQIF